MRAPLRVGIALTALGVPHWVDRLVAALEDAPEVALERLFLVPGEAPPPPSRGFRLYELVDRRVFGRRDDALHVTTLQPRASLALDAPAADEAQELDVVLCLGRVGVHRFGSARVWTLRGPDELFQAIGAGRTESYVAIEEPGTGRIVASSTFATYPLSLHRNRDRAGWKARDLFLRGLHDLHRGEVAPWGESPAAGSATPIRIGSYLARVARTTVRRQIHWKLHREEWFLAYRCRDGDRLEFLDPPPARFYADPIVFERQGHHHVFFEEYLRERGRAVISHLELGPHGPTQPRVVLERDYHLSYPFVFEWNGEIWMIPATDGVRTIELYRADPFPQRWTLERTLFDDVYALDTTLLEHGGRLWLFTNLVESGAVPNEELFVFSAESLEDDWTPHPRNPVVADVRHARPAGPIFRRGDELIRPAQDCALRYGHAIVFNRIDVLDERTYHETPVARIDPSWRPHNLGTHTYSADSAYEVLDGYNLRPRLPSRPGSEDARLRHSSIELQKWLIGPMTSRH